MKFAKRSTLTGKVHTLDIPVTLQQILAWNDGKLIQDAMPNLSPEHREFLMTGITPEEWNKFCAPGGDETL